MSSDRNYRGGFYWLKVFQAFPPSPPHVPTVYDENNGNDVLYFIYVKLNECHQFRPDLQCKHVAVNAKAVHMILTCALSYEPYMELYQTVPLWPSLLTGCHASVSLCRDAQFHYSHVPTGDLHECPDWAFYLDRTCSVGQNCIMTLL